MDFEQQLISINGTVSAVVYRNEQNGYAVLRFLREDESEITVTGILPEIAPGEELSLDGVWVTHPSYGDQFSCVSYERRLPATEKGIYDYLASGAIKGIGPHTARRIVETFGDDSLRVIAEEPALLSRIRGISSAGAEKIAESFGSRAALRLLTELFIAHGIPVPLAVGVYAVYSTGSVQAVKDNPYLLCEERWSVDFGICDGMALSFGIAIDSPLRLKEALIYELYFNMQNGHSFIPRAKLIAATAALLGIDAALLPPALDALHTEGRIICEQICGEDAVYLTGLYSDEAFIAASLQSRLAGAGEGRLLSEKKLDALLEAGDIVYSDEQRRAVSLAAGQRVLILTGGPGTGKTTTVKGIIGLFRACGLETVLAAPTGRAAKRMTELTGWEARTIHRLLEAAFSTEHGVQRFQKNENNHIDADAVIIDESSMLDVRVAAALLRALRPTARIVFVGDPDQLPPVGPGAFLLDLLHVDRIPSVCLTEIFRQAMGSAIVTNAHQINRGIVPDLRAKTDDFYFIRRDKPADIINTMVLLAEERIPNTFGIPSRDIQVLSPWRQRECGTVALNRVFADRLNPADPAKNELRAGALLFREGDRVMQIRNNYDLAWERVSSAELGTGVFNGDIGEVICVDHKSEELVVLFDSRLVRYPFSGVGELELAYAVTVHKSQGSEFDAIILAAAPGPSVLLTRSILYTAVTRAKRLLVIVGQEEVVETMVKSNRKDRRYSALTGRLSDGR